MILDAINRLNEEINVLEDDGLDATALRRQLPSIFRDLRQAAGKALTLGVHEHADLADAAYGLCYGRMEDDPQAQPGEWRELLRHLLHTLLERTDITLLPAHREGLARMREAAQRPADRLGYAATAAAVRRTLTHPTPSLRPYL